MNMMDIRDYCETRKALNKLKEAALSLVRVDWEKYPCAKDVYEKIVGHIGELKAMIRDDAKNKYV